MSTKFLDPFRLHNRIFTSHSLDSLLLWHSGSYLKKFNLFSDFPSFLTFDKKNNSPTLPLFPGNLKCYLPTDFFLTVLWPTDNSINWIFKKNCVPISAFILPLSIPCGFNYPDGCFNWSPQNNNNTILLPSRLLTWS